MNYQLFVFCPDDEKIINEIIVAASKTGAGVIGKYSQCAFVTKGLSQWKNEQGSHPTIGKIGKLTQIKGAKIEMACTGKIRKKVEQAIRHAHPYEEPAIWFIKLA